MELTNGSQSKRPPMVSSSEFALRFLKALGIDGARCRRLIIDAEVQHVLKVYVEYYGDERVLDIRFPELGEVDIRGVPAPDEDDDAT